MIDTGLLLVGGLVLWLAWLWLAEPLGINRYLRKANRRFRRRFWPNDYS